MGVTLIIRLASVQVSVYSFPTDPGKSFRFFQAVIFSFELYIVCLLLYTYLLSVLSVEILDDIKRLSWDDCPCGRGVVEAVTLYHKLLVGSDWEEEAGQAEFGGTCQVLL